MRTKGYKFQMDLKVKLNIVGDVNHKYKARLTVEDFLQVVGIDWMDIFSLVKINSV
jgi:hypothetical protein